MQRIQNREFTLNPQDYYSSGEVRKQLSQIGKIISKSLSRSGQTFKEQLHKVIPLKRQKQMKYEICQNQSLKTNFNINEEQPLHKRITLKQTQQRLINNQLKNGLNQNSQILCQDEIVQCFNNQQYLQLQSSNLKTSFRISRLSNHNSFLKQKKDIGKISNKSLPKIYMSESHLINNTKEFKQKESKQKSPGFLTQRKKQQSNFVRQSPEISQKMEAELNKKQQELKRLLQRNRTKSIKQKRPKLIQLPSVNKINKNILKFRQFVSKTNNNSPQNILNKTSQKLYYVFSQSPIIIQTDKLKEIKFHKNSSKYLEAVHFNQNQDSPLSKVNFLEKRKNRFNLQESKKKYRKEQQISIQKEYNSSYNSQKVPIKSRIRQTYSIQTNMNRKPLSVNQLIDTYPQQKLFSSTQQIKNQFSQFFKYFLFLKQSYMQQSQERENIFMTTKVSHLKTLLIDLEKKSTLKIAIPNILLQKYLDSKFMQSLRQLSTFQLHNIFQILLEQVQNSSKLVKVKKYQNCMYISTKKMQKNLKSQSNTVFALVWHFSGNLYLGDWIQAQERFQQKNQNCQTQNNISLNKKNNGFREGIGLQIQLLKQKTSNNQYKETIDIYFGQFKKKERHGYGLRVNLSSQSQILESQTQKISEKINQKFEIGCWQNNLKHGWIKSFLNDNQIENAQYSSNAFVKNKPQKQKLQK